MDVLDIFEPEEIVGKAWHRLALRLGAPERHEDASVALEDVAGRLAVLFRGLGGAGAVEIRAVADETSGHRLHILRRLGTVAEAVPRASFDGAVLRLPARLAVFPAREANAALYFWLAALAAHAPESTDTDDPLRRDLIALEAARTMIAATRAEAPGLAPLWADLAAAHLALRTRLALPPTEAAVEALVRAVLGDPAPLSPLAEAFNAALAAGDIAAVEAPRRYRPYAPVPLWPEIRPLELSQAGAVETRQTDGTPEGPGEEGAARKARRHKTDQAERNDSFILHKFEALLSVAQFVNLNRRVEDDDEDSAKKAADDMDEIGLGQLAKAPATRLRLHLDLAPEDADLEALSAEHSYPEWDTRRGRYLANHVRVLAAPVVADASRTHTFDARAEARIRAVRRQFEALRPALVSTPGHLDGDELDTGRAVRAIADFRATGESDARVWRQTRPLARDLAVSILLDVSRSTEGAVSCARGISRQIIEIEREALAALAWGLDACGDSFAIHGFSSLRRDRVFLHEVKRFEQPMNRAVEARIAALKPGFYTRLGAAIRHASADLASQSMRRRLLIVITDGKPNDLDHYEGRHGIEDSRRAVIEARRAGHAVFGITVDREGRAWFARIFGQGGFALVPEPDKLAQALPRIYAHIVGS
ncbi:MAG: nitric oxide reductase D protein [Rhodobacterales bacterium CG2_30_65_12]|nr:MAG: nitric oxide reductase D protein [Rhodobacterales bacterium CG2_30_65_12]